MQQRVLWVCLFGLIACECSSKVLAETASCGEPFPGAKPFGRQVSGELEFTVGGVNGPSRTERETLVFDVYAPRGFVAGGPVVLAAQTYGGMHAESGVLDERGIGQLLWGGIASMRDLRLAATISSSGVRVQASKNFADPGTDVMTTGDGEGDLCPAGTTAAPTIVAIEQFVGPLSRLLFSMNVPLEESTLEVITVTQAGPFDAEAHVVGTNYDQTYDAVELTPDGVFPPTEDVEVEFEGLKDVLGREVPGHFRLRALKTTAPLADLELDTVNDGALASTCATHSSHGVLTLGDDRWGCAGRQDALIQLPDPDGATHVELTFAPSDWEPDSQSLAVIRAGNGYFRMARMHAEQTMVLEIPPGTGTVWLAVHFEKAVPLPQNLPPAPEKLVLERIAFTP